MTRKYKILITTLPVLLGLTVAYAATARANFYYIKICDSPYSYTRVSNYDTAHCHFAFIRPCVYLSPVNLGAYTYEASLKAAGAVPGSAYGCYIVE
jgi:hypothetical protein